VPVRSRVPRNTLSRPLIVETTLTLLDDEGLEALTMPRLAAQLGVGTMSLYRHIDGKDDLVNAVAAHLLRGVAVPSGAPDDWEGRVVGYLRAFRTQALRHPALARILAERGLTVAPVLEQLEAVHGILRTAGFPDLDAVRAYYSLLVYVFGSLLWELPRVHQQPPAAYAAAWHRALDGADPDAFPNLMALRDTLPTSASDDQFEYGLQRLVDALRPQAKARLRKRPGAPRNRP
jgi:TetR/AcrR family tetracycline transcriptional repressor